LRRQLPEITDFYLPPEGCSYRLAVVSMRKQYPGHAKRVLFGIWSILRQFMYTKFIIVVDDDVDIRDWKEVVWAMTTRMDPVRDTVLVENTPIDYLDFASPVSGLGGKMGMDATNKWPGETDREWGRPIRMDDDVRARVDAMWGELGLSTRRPRIGAAPPPTSAAGVPPAGPAPLRRPASTSARDAGRPWKAGPNPATTPPGSALKATACASQSPQATAGAMQAAPNRTARVV